MEKAHGHDRTNIRMLKICGPSIRKSLEFFFQIMIRKWSFSTRMEKKQMLFQFIKNDKQSLANYRSISLLPIRGKIFERLLYKEMFDFFIINHLITTNKSSFKLDDTSLFSIVTGPNATANQINNDLHNTDTSTYQRKMNFNPDTSKHAQEVIFSLFSRKIKVTAHTQLPHTQQ